MSGFYVDHVFIVARLADNPDKTLTLMKGNLDVEELAAQLEIAEAAIAKLRTDNPALQRLHAYLKQYLNNLD